MVRKRDFDLYLLAAGDAAVKGPGIVEDAMEQRMIFVRDRPGEFAPDQEVREIGEQLQIGETFKEVEREVEVGRHAVAMRFDEHREIDLFGEGGYQPPSSGTQSCNRRGRISGWMSI